MHAKCWQFSTEKVLKCMPTVGGEKKETSRYLRMAATPTPPSGQNNKLVVSFFLFENVKNSIYLKKREEIIK